MSLWGEEFALILPETGLDAAVRRGEDSDALLRAADVALYAAKGAGRDRVVVGSAEKR